MGIWSGGVELSLESEGGKKLVHPLYVNRYVGPGPDADHPLYVRVVDKRGCLRPREIVRLANACLAALGIDAEVVER